MKAQDYLWEYKRLKAIKESIDAEIEMIIIDEALPGSPSFGDTIKSGGMDDQAFSRHQRIEKRRTSLDRIRDDIQDEMNEIRDRIRMITDGRYISILELRYINGLNLSEVAKKMSYSHDRVRHLHGDALNAFETTNREYLAHYSTFVYDIL